MFSRNAGFINQETQEKLGRIKAAIAGCGGDGGHLAITLARMGVTKFNLADPEVFEIENTNRQAGCNSKTLGQNKAEVIEKEIKLINPSAETNVLNEGVTQGNIDQFLNGVDIVIDETEFTQHHIGVLIARESRKRKLTVFMGLNVGFGCLVTSFNPGGLTFEEYLGLDEQMSLEDAMNAPVSLEKWVPALPSYIDEKVVQDVAQGNISAPSVSPGVALCAGVLATEVYKAVNGDKPTEAPSVLWVDALEPILKIVDTNQA